MASIVLPKSALKLHDLRLQVHLGCTSKERENKQPVSVDLEFRFQETPAGCRTDQLGDTLCYAEASGWVSDVVGDRHFQLIENLGWEIFQTIKEKLPQSIALGVSTRKVSPPIKGLEGGAIFELKDWNL